MGLAFPCGPEMERLALAVGGKKSPGIKVSVKDGKCNLSGLENKAIKLFEETGMVEDGKAAEKIVEFVENKI